MADKKYKLRFLPLFEQDLNDTVDYISLKLKNPGAAQKLVNEIQSAIRKNRRVRKVLNLITPKRNTNTHITVFM